MDMKSLLEKMSQLSGDAPSKQIVTESEKEKKLPPWLKKDKDGKVKKADDSDDGDDDADDKEKVDEAISIQADGAEATSLLDILKLAGQPAPQTEPVVEPAIAVAAGPEQGLEGDSVEFAVDEEDDFSYANSPDERISGMDAATPSGDDLNKKKDQFKHNYRGGDNPMAMREEVKKIEGKLAKMFESMSKE